MTQPAEARTTSKAIEAILKNSKVLVTTREDADVLQQGGYGTPLDREEGAALQSYEALHLLEDKRLRVVDGVAGDEIDFQGLLERLRAVDAEAWTRYLIYRDLRSRGYVVRDGFGFGFDFRMYERGDYGKNPANYVIFGVQEGKTLPLEKLGEVFRFARSMKKELVLAVVDRRGEVVYYSISQLNPP